MIFISNNFDIYKIIIQMINEIKNNKRGNKFLSSIPAKIVAKEMSTIKISLGRRAGHSTAIEKLVSNKIVKNPLVVSPFGTIRVPHIRLNDIEKQIGLNFDSIIVDDFSSVNLLQLNKLYDMFSHLSLDPNFFFLLAH